MSDATGHSASTDPVIWTTRRLLDWIRTHLDRHGVDSPRVCAELLMTSVLHCERMRLYMEPDRPASVEERATLRDLVARAARHEPVQYLVGEAWFFARPFEVGPAVLIPRPATETLVEATLRWCRAQPARSMLRGLDVGTGSGCIATSLVAEMRPKERVSDRFEKVRMQRASLAATSPEEGEPSPPAAAVEPAHAEEPSPEPTRLELVAVDCSRDALAVAARNAARHGVHEAIDFREGDLLAPVNQEAPFDFLCSNPPYISDAEWEKVAANVKDHEPTLALRGGRDGLDVIRRLVSQAPERLRRSAAIFIEIQYDQGKAVGAMLKSAGFVDVQVLRDHEGHERVVTGVRG
jgi:release factor glutamine methyltransferase